MIRSGIGKNDEETLLPRMAGKESPSVALRAEDLPLFASEEFLARRRGQVRARLVVFLGQQADNLQRRHAAHARSGDGLAINIVCHVTSGEYAWDRGFGAPRFRDEIAAVFEW